MPGAFGTPKASRTCRISWRSYVAGRGFWVLLMRLKWWELIFVVTKRLKQDKWRGRTYWIPVTKQVGNSGIASAEVEGSEILIWDRSGNRNRWVWNISRSESQHQECYDPPAGIDQELSSHLGPQMDWGTPNNPTNPQSLGAQLWHWQLSFMRPQISRGSPTLRSPISP